MIRTIADGKSRFALIPGWIAAHRGPLPGEISGSARAAPSASPVFGRISTVNYFNSPFLRFDLYV
jgi:hypothetical protein